MKEKLREPINKQKFFLYYFISNFFFVGGGVIFLIIKAIDTPSVDYIHSSIRYFSCRIILMTDTQLALPSYLV